MSQNQTYTIHITKTDEPEKANANLETLAIENILLDPPFDPNITHYTAYAPFSFETIHILTIPASEHASFIINQPDTLSIGDNTITITVTAPNGVSAKEYLLTIHRRSEEEQQQYEIEQEQQAEQLYTIYNQTSADANSSAEEAHSVQTGRQYFLYIVMPVFFISCCIFILVVYILQKKNGS